MNTQVGDKMTEDKLQSLSETEEQLFNFIKENTPVTFDEITTKLGPKYVGAVGKLKNYGLVTFKKYPSKQDKQDSKKPLTWHGKAQLRMVKHVEVNEEDDCEECPE